MDIEPMDYNSRLDNNNFDDEIKFRLSNEDINREDLLDFLSEGFIAVQQFVDYIDFLDYMEGDDR